MHLKVAAKRVFICEVFERKTQTEQEPPNTFRFLEMVNEEYRTCTHARTQRHTHIVENGAREREERPLHHSRRDDYVEENVETLKMHRKRNSRNSSTKRMHAHVCVYVLAHAHSSAVNKENACTLHGVDENQQQCNTCAGFVRKTDLKIRDKAVPIACFCFYFSLFPRYTYCEW